MGWAMAVIPFALLALGVPIFLVLLATVIVLLVAFMNVPYTVVPQMMFGGVRGSLALTTVGTCEFFGAISGSSPATVAAVGRIMYPALRADGYEDKFALGLVTSSGAIAGMLPPSILMTLYD